MAVFPSSEAVGMAEVVREVGEIINVWGVVGEENSPEVNFALLDDDGRAAVASVKQYLEVLPALFEMNLCLEEGGELVERRGQQQIASREWVVAGIREEGQRGFEHKVPLERIMQADGFYSVQMAQKDDLGRRIEASSVPGNALLFKWSENS